jgi:VanZ family protein
LLLKAYAPLAGWAAVLFALSSLPSSALPRAAGVLGLDKVTHLALYAVFGALSARGQIRHARMRGTATPPSLAVVVVLATLSALAFGITDEIHQIFVPGRSADWHDGLADTLGGFVGGLLFTRFVRPQRGDRTGA